jgi:hypothetical protein
VGTRAPCTHPPLDHQCGGPYARRFPVRTPPPPPRQATPVCSTAVAPTRVSPGLSSRPPTRFWGLTRAACFASTCVCVVATAATPQPEAGQQFDLAMRELGVFAGTNHAVAVDFPWAHHVSRVVDVGGGVGCLAQALLRVCPGLTEGVVMDLPHVTDRSRALQAQARQQPEQGVCVVVGNRCCAPCPG